MAEKIFSRDHLLIEGFPLNLLTASLICVAAASQGHAVNGDQTQSMLSHPTGRGLDARLWRSEFGSLDLQNAGRKKPAFEEKSAIPKEASCTSGALRHESKGSEPKAPKEQQQDPTLQSEDPVQAGADARPEKNSRQPNLRKAVTTAVTMNDVNSSESVQNDEGYETDGSVVQVSMVTVSDWDRAAADSMRSDLSTGATGPSLTTYLVGIAALIVVGGVVLSPR
jgi:hypothetical protein